MKKTYANRVMSAMCVGYIQCQKPSVLTTKNDPSQQDLEGGRCTVFDSHQHGVDSQRLQQEGIISITHTHTNTSTHATAQIFIYRKLKYIPSDMRKSVHACLHGKKEPLDRYFQTSNRA